ncbi:hypothetical protein BDV12DRAFT_200326 [Aspergillus spectabilis]
MKSSAASLAALALAVSAHHVPYTAPETGHGAITKKLSLAAQSFLTWAISRLVSPRGISQVSSTVRRAMMSRTPLARSTQSPDGPMYLPKHHDTYDPNWRELIGAHLDQIVVEFELLPPEEQVERITHSLEIVSAGALQGNRTFPEEDNLILGYSNIQLMGNIFVG